MKTLFTFALAGLLATSSFAANENEDLTALSSVTSRFQKVNVLLREGIGKAKIAIMDEDGKMLHQTRKETEHLFGLDSFHSCSKGSQAEEGERVELR